MLNVIPLKLPGGVNLTEFVTERLRLSGPFGALLLGVLFALAFCPLQWCAVLWRANSDDRQ